MKTSIILSLIALISCVVVWRVIVIMESKVRWLRFIGSLMIICAVLWGVIATVYCFLIVGDIVDLIAIMSSEGYASHIEISTIGLPLFLVGIAVSSLALVGLGAFFRMASNFEEAKQDAHSTG